MSARDAAVVNLDNARAVRRSAQHREHEEALNRFLAENERRAYQRTRLAVGNTEDALDIVQDAMLKLTRQYRDKQPGEWPLLFQRVLQSTITDFYRRQSVRQRVLSWVRLRPEHEDEDDGPEPDHPDPGGRTPLEELMTRVATEQLLATLEQLPVRQQQVFILRMWDGYSTAEAAYAMSCGEGSVKTHLSRALRTLRDQLEEHAP